MKKLFAFAVLLLFFANGFSQEDLTTYTEIDASDQIYVTEDSINVRPYDDPNCYGLSRSRHDYVYKDFGVNYFDGDFHHEFDFTVLSSTCNTDGGLGHYWTLSQVNDDAGDLSLNSENYLTLLVYNGFSGSSNQFIRLEEGDSGTTYTDDYAVMTGIIDTHFWMSIIRDESASTYGTLYCYIYSDEDRTVGVDTLSLELHSSKKDYRYMIPVSTRFTSLSDHHTQVSKFSNLNLDAETSGGSSSQASSRRTRRRGISRTIFR